RGGGKHPGTGPDVKKRCRLESGEQPLDLVVLRGQRVDVDINTQTGEVCVRSFDAALVVGGPTLVIPPKRGATTWQHRHSASLVRRREVRRTAEPKIECGAALVAPIGTSALAGGVPEEPRASLGVVPDRRLVAHAAWRSFRPRAA